MPDGPWQDIDWELISRFLRGDLSPEEAARLEAWLAAAPERRELIEAARRIGEPGDEPPLAQLEKRILASAGLTRRAVQARGGSFDWPRQSSRWRVVLQTAAALALVVGGSVAVWRFRGQDSTSRSTPAESHEIATARGERRSVRFGDGTEVTRGPASTLRWDSDYGRHDRSVELEGEAVFVVGHDSARPFAVRTDHLVARDLGTRFLVRAFGHSAPADVVVAEGSVVVRRSTAATASTTGDSLPLEPGERARLDSTGRLSLARSVPLGPYFDWTEGSLVFHDTPLREAAERRGRWYGIEVRLVGGGLDSTLVTASFRYEPAQRAIDFIAVALGLEVERHGSAYVLRSNRP